MKANVLWTAALALCAPFCEAWAASLNLGAPTPSTPYDAYLAPMWAVLRHLAESQPDPNVVGQLVREGHGFRYVYKTEQPYEPQTPEQTEAIKAGDCKAKSLWLAAKMNCRQVRFVVGKARLAANLNHAWLLWNSPEGWLILDATNYSRPLSADKLSPNEFIPTYSYSPAGKYIHTVAAEPQGAKYADHL